MGWGFFPPIPIPQSLDTFEVYRFWNRYWPFFFTLGTAAIGIFHRWGIKLLIQRIFKSEVQNSNYSVCIYNYGGCRCPVNRAQPMSLLEMRSVALHALTRSLTFLASCSFMVSQNLLCFNADCQLTRPEQVPPVTYMVCENSPYNHKGHTCLP